MSLKTSNVNLQENDRRMAHPTEFDCSRYAADFFAIGGRPRAYSRNFVSVDMR